MTLAQIYLDTPEIEQDYAQPYAISLTSSTTNYQRGDKLKLTQNTNDAQTYEIIKNTDSIYVPGTTKKPSTDSPRGASLPKLKNMSRCKAWKGNT